MNGVAPGPYIPLDEAREIETIVGLLPDCDHPTSRGVCPGCVADAVLGSGWLIDHDRRVKAEAVRESRANLSAQMENFPARGKHTRAGWAVAMLGIIADRIEAAS